MEAATFSSRDLKAQVAEYSVRPPRSGGSQGIRDRDKRRISGLAMIADAIAKKLGVPSLTTRTVLNWEDRYGLKLRRIGGKGGIVWIYEQDINDFLDSCPCG